MQPAAARARSKRARLVRAAVYAAVAGLALYMLAGLMPASGAGRGAAFDVLTPPSLHGQVAKRGPLAYVAQLAALREDQQARDLYFPEAWMQRRVKGERSAPPAAPAPIMWNDKYKIIFVKNVKTAGSTLLNYFTICTDAAPSDRCLTYMDVGNATHVQHLLDVWDSYYVFTFGRNVLRRTISQYQYLTHFMTGECAVSWDRFCQDPYMLGDICYKTPSCCNVTDIHQYLHVVPQANCLVTEAGQLAVDWVGRVEHFDADFAALLGALNAREGGLPKLPSAKPKKQNFNQSPCTSRRLLWDVSNGTFNPCDRMDFFRKEHAQCLSDVVSFYADDVRLLMS